MPFALLAACAFARPNRQKGMRWIWPLFAINWAIIFVLRYSQEPSMNFSDVSAIWATKFLNEMGMSILSQACLEVFYFGLQAALLAVCAVYLIAPRITKRSCWRSTAGYAGTFLGFGIFAIFCDYCFGWSIEVAAVLIGFMLCTLFFAVLLALTAAWLRNWLYVVLIMAGYASICMSVFDYAIPYSWNRDMIFAVFTYLHTLLAINAVIFVPFIVFAVRNKTCRERFVLFSRRQ